MKQVSEATIERARVLMQDGCDRSSCEVAAALKLGKCSAANALKALHERRLIYIVDYQRSTRNSRWSRVYRIGTARDVRAPKGCGKRAAQSAERSWLAESRATASVIFRHPWDVWLFGECAEIAPSVLPRHIVKQDMTGESLEDRRAA